MRSFDEIGYFDEWGEPVNNAYQLYASMYLDCTDDSVAQFKSQKIDVRPYHDLIYGKERERTKPMLVAEDMIFDAYMSAAVEIADTCMRNGDSLVALCERYPFLKNADADLMELAEKNNIYNSLLKMARRKYTIEEAAKQMAESIWDAAGEESPSMSMFGTAFYMMAQLKRLITGEQTDMYIQRESSHTENSSIPKDEGFPKVGIIMVRMGSDRTSVGVNIGNRIVSAVPVYVPDESGTVPSDDEMAKMVYSELSCICKEYMETRDDNYENIANDTDVLIHTNAMPGKNFRKARTGDVVDPQKSVPWNAAKVKILSDSYEAESTRLDNIRRTEYKLLIERAARILSKESGIALKNAIAIWTIIDNAGANLQITINSGQMERYMDIIDNVIEGTR